MVEKKYAFGDDLPKNNPWQDDRLGFAPFAERISRVIITLNAPNGYVVGLHGQWGSGKSTVINFVLAYIRKHNEEFPDDRITHIDFQPWIVSGHQDLIIAFFKLLSETLGPKHNKWKRLWRRICRFFYDTTDNLIEAAAKVALTVDPSGTTTGFGVVLAKKSVTAMLGRFLEDPSLQTSYENLTDQLRRSGKRFLVTIDDIDRLEDAHIRTIMQLVKSIGRLPNVAYFLSYDRQIVWDSLDRDIKHSSTRYAEKIIQHEIDLPLPSRNALFDLLDEEISFFIAETPDTARWQYILRDGVYRWIRSPRDVVRLSNAVKFSWPAVEGEIDPQDLLAMEGLRLFDPAAFTWIRDHRDFLFTEGRFVLAGDQIKEQAVDELKQRVAKDVQPQVLRILTVLFPRSGKWFEGREYFMEEEPYIDVVRRRGVGSEAGYDTYFGLHPSSDAIPKAVVDDLLARSDSTGDIEQIIRSYLGKKNSRGQLMISKLLDELRVQFGASNPARPTQALLDALFRVGEDIIAIDWDGDMFQLSPRAQLRFLIRNMLVQWGLEQGSDRMVEAFNNASSPAFMAEVFVSRGRELGVFASNSSEGPTITAEKFAQLGQILLARIQAAVENGTLCEAPYYFDIARSWGHLAGPNIVKAWLEMGMLESAEFMCKVGRGLVRYSIGSSERSYTMRDAPEPELYDLLTLVEAGQRHLIDAELGADRRNLLSEIVRGAQELIGNASPQKTDDEDGIG